MASGYALPVPDPLIETAEFYRVSKLKVDRIEADEEAPQPPWHGVPPPLEVSTASEVFGALPRAQYMSSRAERTSPSDANTNRFGLVGFSFGGMLAARTGLVYPNGVNAVVVSYPITNYRLELAFRSFFAFPASLILQGDDDSRQPADRSRQLDWLIEAYQPMHDFHLYKEVGHEFNSRPSSGHDPAAADAWQRTLSFL